MVGNLDSKSLEIYLNNKLKWIVIPIADWPVEYIIYTATFPSALTGADLAIFAGCFSYISDITSVKSRTLRVGILDLVYLSAMPSGVALGKFNYTYKQQYFRCHCAIL